MQRSRGGGFEGWIHWARSHWRSGLCPRCRRTALGKPLRQERPAARSIPPRARVEDILTPESGRIAASARRSPANARGFGASGARPDGSSPGSRCGSATLKEAGWLLGRDISDAAGPVGRARAYRTIRYQAVCWSWLRSPSILLKRRCRDQRGRCATIEVNRVSIWFFNEAHRDRVPDLYDRDNNTPSTGRSSAWALSAIPGAGGEPHRRRAHAWSDPRTVGCPRLPGRAFGHRPMLDAPCNGTGHRGGRHERTGAKKPWRRTAELAASIADPWRSPARAPPATRRGEAARARDALEGGPRAHCRCSRSTPAYDGKLQSGATERHCGRRATPGHAGGVCPGRDPIVTRDPAALCT
jgi:hypothetical protein